MRTCTGQGRGEVAVCKRGYRASIMGQNVRMLKSFGLDGMASFPQRGERRGKAQEGSRAAVFLDPRHLSVE